MITVEFITHCFTRSMSSCRDPQTPEAHLLAQRGRHLGAVTRAQRRGQPGILSLVDARLSAVISAAP